MASVTCRNMLEIYLGLMDIVFASKLGYTINKSVAYVSFLFLKTKARTCRFNAGNVSKLEMRRLNFTLHGEFMTKSSQSIRNTESKTVDSGQKAAFISSALSNTLSACHLFFSCRSSRRNLQSCWNKRLWEADADDDVIICLYYNNKHTTCFISRRFVLQPVIWG
jgi:hypothetical protein